MAALTLAVDPLVQAEDPEHVFVDLAREVPLEAVLEEVELGLHLGIERLGGEFSHVDRHRHQATGLSIEIPATRPEIFSIRTVGIGAGPGGRP